MKAIFLVKNGATDQAFEIREADRPVPNAEQVLIEVEAFGLNFADVMARKGLYRDCPPLPAIVGYDVVGRIVEKGKDVQNVDVGQRVSALTRFGGYAEFAVTQASAVAPISESMDIGSALALATQYCTAYYCAEEMSRLHPNDKVLVHAAAGGVGTALVQIAKYRGCEIFGTASTAKMDYLKKQGVHHPIDYRTSDFAQEIKNIIGDTGLDVIFDPIGGKYFKKGFKLLGSGGRIISFGASEMTNAKNIFQKLKFAKDFGIFHPVQFVMTSKSLLGVNMLRIADDRPLVFNRVFNEVIRWYEEGIFQPVTGKIFQFDEIAKAHQYMESRQSIGKIVVKCPHTRRNLARKA